MKTHCLNPGRPGLVGAGVLCALIARGTSGDDALPGYRVLAVSERPAAGVVDETYESFVPPVLGNGGEVAFTARFKTKVPGQFESALYVGGAGGSVAPLVRR